MVNRGASIRHHLRGLVCSGLLGWGAAWAGGTFAGDINPRCDFSTGRSGVALPAQAVVHVVLSPRMPYALREWRRMAASARVAGFPVVAWRDPRVPEAEWQAAIDAAELPELRAAPALALDVAAACQMLNHAPATVVARCGRGHPWPILGVMPDVAWLQLLDARRADLEQVPCA